MKFSKILFIGLGGAGQRHLRIIRALVPPESTFFAYRRTSKTPLLRADFSVNEKESVAEVYKIKIFTELQSAFSEYPELTVISTPTSCHRESLLKAAEAGSGIIVEKPWAESLDNFSEFRKTVLKKKLPFLISFQRRYHSLIAKANSILKEGIIGKPITASFTVFSDVTTWHVYEDWKDLYAVRKDLGGGVLLTEIHEIDLAYWFFGMPFSVFCTGGNRGKEKLEVEDTIQLTLVYDNFSVQITLCFMHKKRIRTFHIAGTEGDIFWNEEGNTLSLNSNDGRENIYTDPDFTNDSMFFAQAKHFISSWTKEDTELSLLSAGSSIAIVEAAKRSIQNGTVERVDTSWMH